jgi:hypothetical protein
MGFFLKKIQIKVNNDMTPSELETELDFSVGNVSSTSTHQLSEESVRCQEELDRNFWATSSLCLRNWGRIKRKK